MTSGTVSDVAKLLTKCNPDELREIEVKVRGLLRIKGEKSSPRQEEGPKEEPLGSWLVDGIIFELRKRGLLKRDGPVMLAPLLPSSPSQFGYLCGQLEETLIWGTGEDKLSYQEKLILGRVAASALATWLAKSIRTEKTISPKIMFLNVKNTLVALDDSFPGYVKARILRFTIGERVERKRIVRKTE